MVRVRTFDDLLSSFRCPIDMEDQQVGVEWIEIVLGRPDEPLGGEATDRPIADVEIGERESLAQVLGYLPRPVLLGDRLAVEEDSHLMAMLGCAGGEQGHCTLHTHSQRRRIIRWQRRILRRRKIVTKGGMDGKASGG